MKKVLFAVCMIATLGFLSISVTAKTGPDDPSWSEMMPGLKLHATKNGQVATVKGKTVYTFTKDTMGRSVTFKMEMVSDSPESEMKMLTVACNDIASGRTTTLYVTPDGRATMAKY